LTVSSPKRQTKTKKEREGVPAKGSQRKTVRPRAGMPKVKEKSRADAGREQRAERTKAPGNPSGVKRKKKKTKTNFSGDKKSGLHLEERPKRGKGGGRFKGTEKRRTEGMGTTPWKKKFSRAFRTVLPRLPESERKG